MSIFTDRSLRPDFGELLGFKGRNLADGTQSSGLQAAHMIGSGCSVTEKARALWATTLLENGRA